MITTTKEINLAQLDAALGSHGLNMAEINGEKTIMPNPDSPVTAKQLSDAVAAHVPIPVPEPTIQEKLASVGLDVNDLKAALGL